MLGQNMQQPASTWGNCHRCGAPKAAMMIGGGVNMILCTRCTSKEDQEAEHQAMEYAKRLGPSKN